MLVLDNAASYFEERCFSRNHIQSIRHMLIDATPLLRNPFLHATSRAVSNDHLNERCGGAGA